MTPGQALIDEGHYEHAPPRVHSLDRSRAHQVDGYRGRAEALLLLGRFADAYR